MTDGASRVRRHREMMKAAGLKPVTIWVRDLNAPGYREALARDIARINDDLESTRVMEDMLELADFSDWK